MKNILIIAVPRSGSTNLLQSISSAYNYEYLFEPRPIQLHTRRWEVKDSQVVKVISYPHLKYPTFYKDIINQYQRTILLSRYNIKEQVESLAILLNRDERIPHTKWNEDELKHISTDTIEKTKKGIIANRVQLEKISKEFNLPINYYEDVYSDKCLIEKDIKLDLTFFEKTKKCRTPSLESKYLL